MTKATVYEPYADVEAFSQGLAKVKQQATAGLPQPSFGPALVESKDGSIFTATGTLVRGPRKDGSGAA